jgi:hypothetical protein
MSYHELQKLYGSEHALPNACVRSFPTSGWVTMRALHVSLACTWAMPNAGNRTQIFQAIIQFPHGATFPARFGGLTTN